LDALPARGGRQAGLGRDLLHRLARIALQLLQNHQAGGIKMEFSRSWTILEMKTKISRIEQKQRILFSGRCGKLWASQPCGAREKHGDQPTCRARRGHPLRPDFQLSDNLWAERGQVFLTGTQALVRLLLMQRAATRRAA
jgi:hypothetical protein